MDGLTCGHSIERARRGFLGAVLFPLLAGCSLLPGGDAPADLPTLVGRFANEPVTGPLTAREAYIADREFFVAYKSGDGVIYSGGRWINPETLAAAASDGEQKPRGPFILNLEFHQPERWQALPSDSIAPRLMPSKTWNRFIDRAFRQVLPDAAMTGIVLQLGEEDYFLFYNDINNFEARLFIDKPENYVVAETIEYVEFMKRAYPVLDAMLEEDGIADQHLLFSTGDTGAYSLPFVFVDRRHGTGVFARFAPPPVDAPAASQSAQVAQSVGHVVHSHLGAIVTRPVSSLYRLLFVAKDAAVETVSPSWMVSLESSPIPEVSSGPGMDLDSFEQELDRITGREAERGTIEYLVDGDEYFVRLIDAITVARRSVDMRTYIFDNDDFAARMRDLLQRRNREGIDVRVLLDGLGTIVATGAHDSTMPEDFVPPQSVHRFLEDGSDVDVRQSSNPWLVAGDHVKTTIIDRNVAFAGGMNIGREYRYTWHDLMMELRGPIVDTLADEFDRNWAHAGFFGDLGYVASRLNPPEPASDDVGYPVRVLHTRPGDPEIFNAQRAAIRNAKHYIYVQNAYFTDDAMLYELASARRRGVDVRVIMPLIGNHGPVNKSNALAANAMLENGIRVFLYPGMSHVKAAIFDGWVCVGSANWDKLSFKTNKELNIATSHPPYADSLIERVFAPDFEKSVELTEPFPERWSDHLMEIVADFVL